MKYGCECGWEVKECVERLTDEQYMSARKVIDEKYTRKNVSINSSACPNLGEREILEQGDGFVLTKSKV